MRIAYVYDVIYPYVKGGAEKRFWELAKRLSLRGHTVHMFGMKTWQGEAHFIKEGVHIHGVGRPIKLYLKKGVRNPVEALYFTYKILPSLWKEKFDIIDCNAFPYLPFFPVKLFSLFKRIPLVITWQEIWGNYWFRYLGYLKGILGYLIERLVIKLSNHIIVHNLKIKEELIKYGVSEKGIIINPHGVDLEIIENIPASLELSDVIFLGRLIKDKNVGILIKAIFLVKKEINNLKCLIIGEGPEKQNLIRLAEELNLENNVIFKDFLEYEKVIANLKASKVFVFPSTREGFGIVVIEAMACGLPVITVEHPMNAACGLIRNSQNGFISKIDERAISQAILKLLRNDSLRANISKAAKDAIREYDWDRIAKENEKFYNYVFDNFKNDKRT